MAPKKAKRVKAKNQPKLKRDKHVYSSSEVAATHRKRRRALGSVLSLAVIGAVVFFGLQFGASLWQRITDNPNQYFEQLIGRVSSASSYAYDLERQNVRGVINGKGVVDSEDFFNPRSSINYDVATIQEGVSLDADILVIADQQGIVAANITDLEFGQNAPAGANNTGSLTDIWVAVPSSVTAPAQSTITQLLADIANGSNSPYGVLPLGNLGPTLTAQFMRGADDIYDIQRCSFVDFGEVEAVECRVDVDVNALGENYLAVAQTAGIEGFELSDTPESFTVFIEKSTNLPLQVSFEDDGVNSTVTYTSFNSDQNIGQAGATIPITDYRQRVLLYESNL